MPRLPLLLPAAVVLLLLAAGASADSNRTWLQRYAQLRPFKQNPGIDHCEAWYQTGVITGKNQTVWCQMETNFLAYTHCCEHTNAIGWTECCFFVQDWILALIPIVLLLTVVYCGFCVRMCVHEHRAHLEREVVRRERAATVPMVPLTPKGVTMPMLEYTP